MKRTEAEVEFVQDIQENLERAKQELSKYSEQLMQEMELQAFGDLYAVSAPTKTRARSAKDGREIRDAKWKAALEKAKGDEKKAFKIWAKLN